MSSIRKRLLAMAAGLMAGAGAMALGGCSVEQRIGPPEALDTTAIPADDAMQQRNWGPTPAYYRSDEVLAGADYAPLRPKHTPVYEAIGWEPALFVANAFYFPVGLFIEFPTKFIAYKAMTMEPTYTAMPPLKPSSEKSLYAQYTQ